MQAHNARQAAIKSLHGIADAQGGHIAPAQSRLNQRASDKSGDDGQGLRDARTGGHTRGSGGQLDLLHEHGVLLFRV